ncbi:MAG: NUDIX hydrolase [Patescibacteria group bacterium]|nr:NUDIX hydrolase [Patescibacteria group bacterium]MDD5121507.1 NUDIX hydrolase [Patescibacteria group bacterium]MDD5222045.1 NUDIX hydrolase [Patescibacteria group bacterium]MDD5396331.1 NUDIX hydrolase [Patescibacteria group bacterium]
MEKYNFQYCQKTVVFSKDMTSVLLCKRKGENDYDGVYSFIGGKMETPDKSFIAGLQREKNEEVGGGFKIEIYPIFTINHIYLKKSGDSMILPHFYARHIEGEIILSDEYSEYQWVAINKLTQFEPKISTIPDVVNKLLELKKIIKNEDLIVI